MIVLILLCLIGSACARENWVEGGLYSTRNKDGSYTVVKILKMDDIGVHVRLYSNRFRAHPGDLDESTLDMAGTVGKPGAPFGVGHMAVRKKSFASWGARFIKVVPVRDEELEGYKMWKKAKGGYF